MSEDRTDPQQNPDAVPNPELEDNLQRAADKYNQTRKISDLDDLIGLIWQKNQNPQELIRDLGDVAKLDTRNSTLSELNYYLGKVDADAINELDQLIDAYAESFDNPVIIFANVEEGINEQQGADPISLFNGEFIHEVEDIRINGAGMDFVFKRTYRNQIGFRGRLGYRWDDSLNLWLRVSPDNLTIFRGNGSFKEEIYIKHPKFVEGGNGPFNYYVPQEGCYGIILENGNDSFIWRSPSGDRHIYRRDARFDFLYRIDRIQDKNGQLGDNDRSNYLEFVYPNSLLELIRVNNQDRVIKFTYDELERIKEISDYTGRKWKYDYDDLGDLVSVTAPSTDRYPSGLSTCYEYSSSQFTLPILQHNLVRIIDPTGQTYLENEYGSGQGILNFNRVIRQRQGNGESYFDYQDVIQEFDHEYTEVERPAHQTNVIEQNGHLVHYIYNKFGNLLLREEEILQGGIQHLIRWRYRYNNDGALIAVRTPEGRLTQYHYGREDYLRRKGITEELLRDNPTLILDDLTFKERMAFGNLLAVVKRGKFYKFSATDIDLSKGVWGNFFPDLTNPLQRNLDPSGNLLDIITRFTYEDDYQQILSSSDPRFTQSAVPNASLDTPRFSETLTTYEYVGRPPDPGTGDPGDTSKLFLKRIVYPNCTQPEGSNLLSNIEENFEEYDNKGRLSKSTNTEGALTTFEYVPIPSGPNDPNKFKEGYLRKTMIDPTALNISTEYEINDVGIVTVVINPKGIGDNSGRFRTEFEINELNQVTKTISSPPFLYKVHNFYDKNGLVDRSEKELKDENGNDISSGVQVKTYKYDDQSNIISESIGGNDPSFHLVTKYKYNESNKRILTILPRGNKIKIDYDERLLEKRITRGLSSEEASTTTTSYDMDGLKIETINGQGNSTKYEYDPFRRLIKTTDSFGNISLVNYDKNGNVVVERFFEKQSHNQFILLSRNEYEYDELYHRIIERKNLFQELPTVNNNSISEAYLSSPGPGDLVETLFFYDRNGRIKKIRDPLIRITSFEYDNADQKVRETDPLDNFIQYSYDLNGNLIRQDIHERVIDQESGNLLRMDVFSQVNAYDELDRLESTTNSLGNVTEFHYDSRNNIIKKIDPLKNIKLFDFDEFGRDIREISQMTVSGLGNGNMSPPIVIESKYDSNGNLTISVDPKGNITEYKYDSLDRRKTSIFPDTSTSKLEHDKNDNVILEQDNNGLRKLFSYDKLDRMFRMDLDFSELVSNNHLQQSPNFEQYEYDGLNRTKSESNNICRIQRKFDSLGRTYEDTFTFSDQVSTISGSFIVQREFDKIGNLLKLVYPNNREIQYQPDELNRIKSIVNIRKGSNYPGSTFFNEQYEILRNEYRGTRKSGTIFGNRSTVSYAYDAGGRITKISHKTFNGLHTIQHLFDGAGNLRIKNETTDITKGESYKYNSVYWLTKIDAVVTNQFNVNEFEPSTVPLPVDMLDTQNRINTLIGIMEQDNSDLTYKYDLNGNRIEANDPPESSLYEPNVLNQYTRVDTRIQRYDLNGNLIDDGNFLYFYDHNNQLAKVLDKVTTQELARYLHDVQGRCTLRTSNNKTIHCIYSGENVIEEHVNEDPQDPQSNSRLLAQYANGYETNSVCQICVDEDPDQNIEGNEYWYHKDLVESVRLLTDKEGVVRIAYTYLPFGTLSDDTSGPYNPYLFMSERFERDVNISNFKSRNYAPRLGRFLQRDLVSSANLYLFVDNNPLIFVDPSGREKEKVTNEPALSPSGREKEKVTNEPALTTDSLFSRQFGIDYWEGYRESYDAYLAGQHELKLQKLQENIRRGAAQIGGAEGAINDILIFQAENLLGGLAFKAILKLPAAIRVFQKLSTPITSGARQIVSRAASGSWRTFGNTWRLILNPRTQYSWKNIFWNPNKFKNVSAQYWRVSGGAKDSALHHLWFQNQSKWIPQGFRNAGFNLLEIPGSLNTWMGGRLGRELAFRGLVTSVLVGTGLGSYYSTKGIMNLFNKDDNRESNTGEKSINIP